MLAPTIKRSIETFHNAHCIDCDAPGIVRMGEICGEDTLTGFVLGSQKFGLGSSAREGHLPSRLP